MLLTGHGKALDGPAMRDALAELARLFDSIAYPPDALYRLHPARAEDGTAHLEPD